MGQGGQRLYCKENSLASTTTTALVNQAPGKDLLSACERFYLPIAPGTDLSCAVSMGEGVPVLKGKCVGLTRGLWWCDVGQTGTCKGQQFGEKCVFGGRR